MSTRKNKAVRGPDADPQAWVTVAEATRLLGLKGQTRVRNRLDLVTHTTSRDGTMYIRVDDMPVLREVVHAPRPHTGPTQAIWIRALRKVADRWTGAVLRSTPASIDPPSLSKQARVLLDEWADAVEAHGGPVVAIYVPAHEAEAMRRAVAPERAPMFAGEG